MGGMDRLTSGTDPNCECSRCTAECVNEWDGLCWVRLAIKRLAAYEDAGLTPDEIAALKTAAKLLESDRDIEREMRLELESEVERLRAENSRLNQLDENHVSVAETADWKAFVRECEARAALEGGQK